MKAVAPNVLLLASSKQPATNRATPADHRAIGRTIFEVAAGKKPVVQQPYVKSVTAKHVRPGMTDLHEHAWSVYVCVCCAGVPMLLIHDRPVGPG